MFGIIELIKLAMSHKMAPEESQVLSNLSNLNGKREVINIQDPDLASIAGSVRGSALPPTDQVEPDLTSTPAPEANTGAMKVLFGGIGSLFGLKKNDNVSQGDDDTPEL